MSQINLTVRALVSSYTKLHWLCLLNDTDCYMCIKKITWIVRACAPDQSLTPLALVYEIFILWNHALRMCFSAIFPSLCNSITCQMIALQSCSNA